MTLSLAELVATEHGRGLHADFKPRACSECFPAESRPPTAPPKAAALPSAPSKLAPHRFVPAIEFVGGQRVCAACEEPRATHPKIPIAPGSLAGVFAELRKTLRVEPADPDLASTELMVDGGPYCELCRGARWMRRELDVTHPDFGRLLECPDCARGFLMQRRLEKLFGSLPELYREVTLDTFPTGHALQIKALARVREWLEDPNQPWLFLSGDVGRGKTGLAVGAVHEAVLRGRSGLFQDVTDLRNHIKRTYRSRDAYEAGEAQLLDALYDVDLLVLDDVAAQNPTDWAVEMLFLIIGGRHRDKRQTIITSNLSLPALAEHMGHPRTASRIQEMARGYIIDVSHLPSLRLHAVSA